MTVTNYSRGRRIQLFTALLCTLLLFCGTATAQSVTVSINRKETTLKNCMDDVERQTSYLFVYDESCDISRKVTVKVKSKPLRSVLDLIFEGSGISYNISGSNIVLESRQDTVKGESQASATASHIHGHITDSKGEPVVGAFVFISGTQTGTNTDIDGAYSLDIPQDIKSPVISVSCIGHNTVQMKVGSSENIDITLKDSIEFLDQAVVIGYGTLDRKEVTSSIASVSADEMMKGVGGADITKSLQGKISGLVIGQTKSVNDSPVMQLRGMASIASGQQPLVVIDGFPGGDIRSLNPEDIKSIDVLKDASAGAIYGTRAAAGVILVTTKSGTDTEGRLNVTYSADLLYKQAYRKPQVLTAEEYVKYGVGTDYGYKTDWWNEAINKKNFSHKHNLSLNFGTEKASVYSSFFYEKQDGIATGEWRHDFGGRINSKFNLLKGWLEFRANIDYRQAKRNKQGPYFGQALLNNPTRSPYDETTRSGYNVWIGEEYDYNFIADAALYDSNSLDKWFKPEIMAKLNILPVEGLSYQQSVGYSTFQYEDHGYTSMYHRASIVNNVNGSASLAFAKNERLNTEGYFSYDRSFKGGHKVNAVLGYSYNRYDGERFSMSNSNFSVDGIKYWDIGKGSYLNDGLASMSSEKNITEKLLAYFVRANYSYNNRYMVSATYRREGSSKFGKKNRWGNFWAVSAGWAISEEKFLKNVKWIDELKLRAGYGVTGNNDFDAAYSGNFIGADENRWLLENGEWKYAYGRSEDVNPNLGWEEKAEWNVGLDFSFFKGRLYGKADIYRRKISNLLFYVMVPQPPYIRGYQWQNIGSMENKGWEVELGGDIIRKNDFTWSTSLNLSGSTSKVLTMDGSNTRWDGGQLPGPNSPGKAIILEEGSTIGQFYLYEFAGFSPSGEFRIVNRNGQVIPASSKIAEDKKLMGNFTPKLMYGWSHTFKYRNFDASISMHGWYDFDVYNTYAMTLGIAGRNGECNVLKDAYSTFSHIKDEKLMSNYYLEDGSFLKIDAVTVGYLFPLRSHTKDFVESLRLYFTAGNLATITGYTGLDPEIDIVGYDGGIDNYQNAYPMTRTFTFGVQLKF